MGMGPADIIIKPQKGDKQSYVRSATLASLQKLTNDKLGIRSNGQVYIMSEGSGSKSTGTSLVRNLISDKAKTVTITNDVSGTDLKSNYLEGNAATIANNGAAASDGTGTGSTVYFSPEINKELNMTDGTSEKISPQVALGHELIHAENNRTGSRDVASPAQTPGVFGNREEEKTIQAENVLRKEQGETKQRALPKKQ